MQLLISLETLKDYKSRDLVPLVCQNCFNTFYSTKKLVSGVIRGTYHGSLNYCSLQCYGKEQRRRQKVICNNCGKEFEKLDKEIKKSTNNFCSKSCNAVYWNKHKRTGFRRSKSEILLEDLIKKDFKDLKIVSSNRSLLPGGLEIDILIPDLKVAIELNGPLHFKPIFGQEKLERIIKNDRIKQDFLKEYNYQFFIVDLLKVSSEGLIISYYKETIKPYLEKIGGE